MDIPKHDVKEYQNISSDVWQYFKKYYGQDFNELEEFEDFVAIGNKYKNNPRLYEFANQMIRIFHKELWEVKELNYGKAN